MPPDEDEEEVVGVGAGEDDEEREVRDPLLRREEQAASGGGGGGGGEGRMGGNRGCAGEEEEEGVKDWSEEAAPGLFVWRLTMSAGVSGLLFGYDTGVISSTLVSIHTSLSHRPLTTLDKSLITSSTSLLALLSSPLSGLLSDRLGRKTPVLLSSVLFVLGALLQAASTTVAAMTLGRAVVGAAVGAASFAAPLYICELAPARARGRLVTVQSLLITGGQVVAYLVGWGLVRVDSGWRWMVGLGAAPAVVQLGLLMGMPESPRWLVKAGRREGARRVLERVYGGAERGSVVVERVLRAVEREIREEEEAMGDRGKVGGWEMLKGTWGELVKAGGNRRALAVACLLQGFQQLCGFNSLMYFSATIFALVGFRSPVLTSLSVALTNFLFTLVAFHAIDRVGRRRILLCSIPVMILGLVLCSVAFSFVRLPEHGAVDSRSTGAAALLTRFVRETVHRRAEGDGAGKEWPSVIVAAMVLYVAGYAVGLGCVPWQQSELFPLPVRSLGSALATATNWGANFLIGLTFLPLMDALTPTGTFALYAAVCVVGYAAVWRVYPETAGLSLEQVGELLRDGWGVRRDRRR